VPIKKIYPILRKYKYMILPMLISQLWNKFTDKRAFDFYSERWWKISQGKNCVPELFAE
jgi:hypothetical protein